jgi:hypothetical protein
MLLMALKEKFFTGTWLIIFHSTWYDNFRIELL